MIDDNYKFSIVILTYNRIDCVKKQVDFLASAHIDNVEIIFVDNYSDVRVDSVIDTKKYNVLRNEKNLGAVGRNKGIEMARGDFVITLDDDVYGITHNHLKKLENIFEDQSIAAVNFRIREEETYRVINWCHPFDVDEYHDRMFETLEISEGAVAFRSSALKEVGLYPEYFFISHEGPDLALRLINSGYRVFYTPEVEVTHAYEQCSRASWRRYYFDTRNELWFVIRNLRGWYAVRRLIIGWGAMFVYSVRDGFLRYWLLAICDSIKGVPRAWRDRQSPSPYACRKWRELERHKPGFWKMVKLRLFKREVRI